MNSANEIRARLAAFFFTKYAAINLSPVFVGLFVASVAFKSSAESVEDVSSSKPNIIYILCDDLGYGDVQCLNPQHGNIATPNIDRLAREGVTFTDCHSSSSVCSPSRYSILTGRYAWRTHLQQSALPGDAPPLIAPGRLTVAELLRQNGYATSGIGKWHLGLKFGERPYDDPIVDGPLNHGFDSFYGISASADLPPFVYFDNDRFLGTPNIKKDWGGVKWGIGGLAVEGFDWEDIVPNLTRRTVSYLESRHDNPQPFFLYLALTSPHTPLLPTADFKGKSGLGDYGDFVMETDSVVGKVLAALEKSGLTENTLVIFTSDNGCAPYIEVADLKANDHFPNGELRGFKFDIWDGGHRVPFIVRWPAHASVGSRNDSLICLSDLMATCADLLDIPLPDNAGEDSVSLLPTMLDANAPSIRDSVVHHSTRGYFAIRQGRWKLNLCAGSGGWGEPSEDKLRRDGAPAIQLYDIVSDPGEQQNLQQEYPEVVNQLVSLLKKQVEAGRSNPGVHQHNDQTVDIWKRAGSAE